MHLRNKKIVVLKVVPYRNKNFVQFHNQTGEG
jgi:hypothetical protein